MQSDYLEGVKIAIYCTTKGFVSEDGQSIPVSAVIEIAEKKRFVLKCKWTNKVKGPKRYIEYWYRDRKVQLSKDQQEKFLIPFNIGLAPLRLD